MTELRFDGLVALVTGVSMDGLGLSYAQALADAGCSVVVNDLGVDWQGNPSGAETEAVVAEITRTGGTATGITGDVVQMADAIVEGAVDAYGRLDVVINNAGAGGDFDTLIDVHLRGAHRITEAAWPHLIRSGVGRIINISSSGSYGAPGMPGYAAAKGGILSLTRSQGILGAPQGIKSNAILPSAWTRSTAGIDNPGVTGFIEKYFPRNEVASFATYLAHESVAVTGEAFAVGGGRVTRVVQAETAGFHGAGFTPAQWGQVIDQVLDPTDLSIATSMWDRMAKFARAHSPEADAEFQALGLDTRTAGKLSTRGPVNGDSE